MAVIFFGFKTKSNFAVSTWSYDCHSPEAPLQWRHYDIWTVRRIKSPELDWDFFNSLFHNKKENIKDLHHWPFVRGIHRWTVDNAPLPQRPVAGRKLVGKRIFRFRPISSDIGRTHFNLSRKDGAGTLLTGVWSEQPVGNLIVTRPQWDTCRTFSSELHRSSSE